MKLSSLLTLFLAAACQTAAPRPTSPPAPVDWTSSFTPAAEVPALLESAFAQEAAGPERSQEPGPTLAPGDSLLVEVTLDEAGQRSTSFLQFEVVGPMLVDGTPLRQTLSMSMAGNTFEFRSAFWRVMILSFDSAATSLVASTASVAEPPATGHVQLCRATNELPRRADGQVDATLLAAEEQLQYQRLFGQSLASFNSMFQLVKDDKVLSELLWRTIERPSLWSLATHLGVDVGISFLETPPVELGSSPAWLDLPGPYFSLPLSIEVNDQPALDVELIVANPTPPWTLSGGVVGLRASHPSKDVVLTCRVVRARLGG